MQQLVHLGHVGLHGPHRPTGPAVKPRLLDQPVRAHRLARVGHQACQEPAPLALRRSMTPADPTNSNEPRTRNSIATAHPPDGRAGAPT
jgi:hypothetical protein